MRAIIIIFAVLLIGQTASSEQSNDLGWKATLKNDLINYISPGSYPPGVNGDTVSLSILVPLKISKELESHPKEEMLSYLNELKDEAPKNDLKCMILSNWIIIVSNGLQGSTTIVTASHDSITEKLPYVRYSYPVISQKRE